MRDPAFRAQTPVGGPARRAAPSRCSTAWSSSRCSASATRRTTQPRREDSLAAIAAREGRTPQEVVYDALLEDDGNAFIYTPLGNYAYYDLRVSETTLADRNCIMGLGDGGAHVAFILDAGYQTWLLDYWGKQRKRWEHPGVGAPADLRHRACGGAA